MGSIIHMFPNGHPSLLMSLKSIFMFFSFWRKLITINLLEYIAYKHNCYLMLSIIIDFDTSHKFACKTIKLW